MTMVGGYLARSQTHTSACGRPVPTSLVTEGVVHQRPARPSIGAFYGWRMR